MDKFLVEVRISAVNVSFDAYVPKFITVFELIQMLKNAAQDLVNNSICFDENTVLVNGGGKILDINKLVIETDIHNGSKLMLV